MEAKQIPTIKINFKKPLDHKTYPVSGAWGGPTPQGDILCNFYIEHTEIPDSLELEVDLATGKPKEKVTDSGKVYVREILTSLLLRPDIAISIGKWLIRKAEDVTKARHLETQETKGTIQ